MTEIRDSSYTGIKEIKKVMIRIIKMKAIQVILALTMVLFFSCGKNEEEGHGHHDEHGHHEGEEQGHITMTPAQVKTAGIVTGEAVYIPASDFVKTTGIIDLPPENLAQVTAQVKGFVKQLNYLPGDYVDKGAVMAAVENPDLLDVQKEYSSARASLSAARQELSRQQELEGAGVGASSKLQRAEENLATIRARVQALEQQLRFVGLSPENIAAGNYSSQFYVRSPFGGYVTEVFVNQGQLLHPEEKIYTVANNEHVHLELNVFEKDINKVREEQDILFKVPGYGESTFRGEVYLVGKSFDPQKRTAVVHGHLEGNHPEFSRGMYVEAKIFTGKDSVLAFPEEAFARDGGDLFLFFMENEGEQNVKFMPFPVETGATRDGYTEVLSVIPSGKKIVTKGAFYIMAERKKGEGGHHHH